MRDYAEMNVFFTYLDEMRTQRIVGLLYERVAVMFVGRQAHNQFFQRSVNEFRDFVQVVYHLLASLMSEAVPR